MVRGEKLAQIRNIQDEEEKSYLKMIGDLMAICCDETNTGMAMEHPHLAMSWKTETMESMPGLDAVCNRCQTGLRYVDKAGLVVGKVKKPTRIRTNSDFVFEALDLPCTCPPGVHVAMDGKSTSLKEMQNYEPGFVKRAASAIYHDMEERWRQREMCKVFVTEELADEDLPKSLTKVTEEEKKLVKTHGKQAWQVVNKLHRQLGHPGVDRMVKSLKDAGMDDNIIRCAREYKCDVCEQQAQRKLEKPASLPQCSHFNECLEADVFHIRWNNEKKKILAVLDVYSKYEINAILDRETEEAELRVLQDLWINVFGPPEKFRTDSSGAHMSQKYLDFFDKNGIKLILVPKEAHYRMGTVERLHAVRRLQLLKMQQEEPNLLLEDAVLAACHQRNRLRTVSGSSPYQIVFGHNPRSNGLLDEPVDLRPPDDISNHQADQALRHLAAKAFFEANNSQLLKRALLARPRSEHAPAQLGDWVYYWRQSDSKLDPTRWRGPALVCAIEPRSQETGVLRASVYWLAHGSSLVRVAPEHIRPEVARERSHRLNEQPSTALTTGIRDRVLQALQPAQGPVRFLDLAPRESFSNAKESNSVVQSVNSVQPPAEDHPDTEMLEPLEPQQTAAAAEQTTSAAAEHPAAAAEHEPPAAAENKPQQEREADQNEQRPSQEQDASRRGRSRSPPPRDERHLAFENLFESYNQARKIDGLPPVSRENPQLLAQYEAMMEEELVSTEEGLLAATFSEKNLTPEQKAEFAEARNKALDVWFENEAWRPVDASEAAPGEAVPARFLQRWKPTKDGFKANARIIIQGFKHKDVLESTVDKEAPTLSMVGRSSVYLMSTTKRWKLWSADVKSAFQQADNIEGEARVFIQPSAEIRRLLERKIGLRPWQIMRASKPAFGDCRAPRQWNATAHHFLTEELGMIPHPLDRCLYLSVRAATSEDPEFDVFQLDGVASIVDGVFGLHVDDFIGAGEQFFSENDLKKECHYDECFLGRMLKLSKRFRFGSWDFGKGSKINFCGAELQQSLDFSTISVSLATYIHKIKPITVDKSRKTMSDSPCDEKEQRQYRALIGALAWPAHQSMPELCASVSLLQAAANGPCINDLNQANKLLRFAKEIGKDHELRMRAPCSFEDLCIGAYTDAAWAVRPDGTSQGGLLIFVCSHAELQTGQPMALNVFFWKSQKLNRVCRSSMSAEAQAAAIAVDELEWCKVFVAALLNPTLAIEGQEALQKLGSSPVVTDAKSLYDAARSITPSSKLSEKRTAIEIAIIRDRMQALDGQWMWVNSHQQVSDGLTKPAAKESLSYILKRGTHQLKFNPDFIAAKKVNQQEKEQEKQRHEAYSKELEENQIFNAEEAYMCDGETCLLPGCNKKRNSDDSRNRYCSRRHFYAHKSCLGKQEAWRQAALTSVALLMTEQLPCAEGTNGEGAEQNHWIAVLISFLVIMFFALIGFDTVLRSFGIETFMYKVFSSVFEKAKVFLKVNSELPELEDLPANVPDSVNEASQSSHGVAAGPFENDEVILNALTLARRPGLDGGSSTCNSESELEDEEWQRWTKLKQIVMHERHQAPYRQLLAELEDNDSPLDRQTRLILTSEGYTTQRWRKFSQLLKAQNTTNFTDEQVKQWHRMWNDNLCFLADVNRKITMQRNRILQLERKDQLRAQHQEGDLKDRMCQTPNTFITGTRPRLLPTGSHGAWEFVNDLVDRT